MKTILILLTAMVLISVVSSLDVKSFWLDLNMTEQEATDLSLGNATPKTEEKALWVQDNQQLNESEIEGFNEPSEVDNLLDSLLILFFFIFPIGSLGLILYLYFSWRII